MTNERLIKLSKALDSVHAYDQTLDEAQDILQREEVGKICAVFSGKDYYHRYANSAPNAAQQIGIIQTACVLLNTGFMFGVRAALNLDSADKLEKILGLDLTSREPDPMIKEGSELVDSHDPDPNPLVPPNLDLAKPPQLLLINNPNQVKDILDSLGLKSIGELDDDDE